MVLNSSSMLESLEGWRREEVGSIKICQCLGPRTRESDFIDSSLLEGEFTSKAEE